MTQQGERRRVVWMPLMPSMPCPAHHPYRESPHPRKAHTRSLLCPNCPARPCHPCPETRALIGDFLAGSARHGGPQLFVVGCGQLWTLMTNHEGRTARARGELLESSSSQIALVMCSQSPRISTPLVRAHVNGTCMSYLVWSDDCRRALHATVIRYIGPVPHVRT